MSHTRTPKLLGRLPLQGSSHRGRIGTEPTVLQQSSPLQSSPNRPVLPHTRQCQASSLRLPLQPPASNIGRLPLYRLELMECHLHLPSPQPDPSQPSQTGSPLRLRRFDCSAPTCKAMVASIKKALRTA